MEFKELLEQRDMTPARLARRLGKTRSAISKWANGECFPRVTDVPELAEVLGVGIEELVLMFAKSKGA